MMFSLCTLVQLCFLGWVSCVTLSHYKLNDIKIVGGQDADIKDYPYQVSLRISDVHSCGGAVISPKFVITAAHCLPKPFINFISAFGGSGDRTKDGQTSELKAIHIHPQYNSTTYDYDLAIVELTTPFKFGPTLQAIPLTDEGSVLPDDTICTITGWGRLNETNASLPHTLQKVDVPIFNKKLCIALLSSDDPFRVTDRMICAGYLEGGKDACQGDSGGPLASNKKLVGVVSVGRQCGEKYSPGVFTSIAVLRSFIKEKTGI